MAGKVYDRHRLTVDRDPLKQLAVEVGKLPTPDPLKLLEDAVNFVRDYLVDAIKQVTGIDLGALMDALDKLRQLLGGIDLFGVGPFDAQAAIRQFVETMLLPTKLLGAAWGDLFEKLRGLPAPPDALGALSNFLKTELGAPITSARLPLLPLSHIRAVNPNLLTDGSFDDEATLAPFDDWDWDNADGRTKPGCAYTVADGATHTLYSNPIEVGPDDELDLEVWAKWTGLATSGAGPVRMAISAYRADKSLIGLSPAIVAVAGAAGSSAGFAKLSTAGWAVPDDAAYVVLELTVAAWATAGVVKFDDAAVRKTGVLPQNYVSGLQVALANAAQRLQDVINQIWTGVTRQALDGQKQLADLFDALGNIPPINIRGVGGGETITDTLTTMWNQFWSGLTRTPGGAKGIADVANAAQEVAAQADNAEQVGVWNNAILGIRNNRPFDSGMDPTAVSMFPIPAPTASGGDPPYVNATATSVPVAFWISPDDAKRGSVQWLGKGNANITALYIDVYRVNKATSTMELLHTSPDQFPQLAAGQKWITYQMPTALRVDTIHGDVVAIAWRVQGTGTHQIACRYGLPAGDPNQVPQRPSATRTAATGLVGNLPFASIPYGGDVPVVALGIVEGDVPPPYYAPRTTEYAVAGAFSYDIPVWANYIDIIRVGAGGGGHGGNGGNGSSGRGGYAGTWGAETLVRGVDFPANATKITGYVGAGGAGGPREAGGGTGEATVRDAIAGGKAAVSAAGGVTGDFYIAPNSPDPRYSGDAPGDFTYRGVRYAGGLGGLGGASNGTGSPGEPAGAGGGGGRGGIYAIAWGGGAGARGGAWIVARQS